MFVVPNNSKYNSKYNLLRKKNFKFEWKEVCRNGVKYRMEVSATSIWVYDTYAKPCKYMMQNAEDIVCVFMARKGGRLLVDAKNVLASEVLAGEEA